jgi:UDP-2-acetamido-3-amino-2,3-dideoxy-glucuronate N-acetyltransferase
MKGIIHQTAIIEENVKIGEGVSVWHNCHVREGAELSDLVSLGKDVFVDRNVSIGRGSRVQNGVSIYFGISIGQWVFVGPNVTFTNDLNPRAGSSTWKISETKLMAGCSIGAGAVILPDVIIGEFSLVGAGSVVTENIPPFHLAYGLPARVVSKLCACGKSRVDLTSKISNCILECCEKNLKQEVLHLAKELIGKFE